MLLLRQFHGDGIYEGKMILLNMKKSEVITVVMIIAGCVALLIWMVGIDILSSDQPLQALRISTSFNG
jgi:hypothetical protein